jgi:hypothetical protein
LRRSKSRENFSPKNDEDLEKGVFDYSPSAQTMKQKQKAGSPKKNGSAYQTKLKVRLLMSSL